jgi:hypothetical protein
MSQIVGTVSLVAFVGLFGAMLLNVNHFFDPVGGVSRLAGDTSGALSEQVRAWFALGGTASKGCCFSSSFLQLRLADASLCQLSLPS